jgi:hypothetical protein
MHCRQSAVFVLIEFSHEMRPSANEFRPAAIVGTFVCQNHPYASEIVEDKLWYLTGSEFCGIISFSIL